MKTLARLKDLGACAEGLDHVRSCSTLREAWDLCACRPWLSWLLGCAHTHGTLPRKRLVDVSIRCVLVVGHLLDDKQLTLLADLQAGEPVGPIRQRLQEIRRQRWTYAAYDAADAAYAADAAAYAADAAADAYAADDAYAYAADDAYAADADDAYAAMCDVIRDAIEVDEVAAALGLDPDEVIS